MYKGTAQYCIYKRTAVLHVQRNCTVLHLQENCSTACTRGISVLMYKGSAVLNVQGNCSTACTWKDDARLEWLIVFNRFFLNHLIKLGIFSKLYAVKIRFFFTCNIFILKAEKEKIDNCTKFFLGFLSWVVFCIKFLCMSKFDKSVLKKQVFRILTILTFVKNKCSILHLDRFNLNNKINSTFSQLKLFKQS